MADKIGRLRFDAQRFYEAFVAVVTARGLTHDEASEACGVYRCLLSRIRREGRQPSVDGFLSMCHWAGLEPMAFYRTAQAAQRKHRPVSSVFGLAQSQDRA